MSSWREQDRLDGAAREEQKRLNKTADAAQRREDLAFQTKLRRDEQRAEKDEKRAEKVQQRRDRAQRKQARAAKREKTLTPVNVYKRGTLALVATSALAAIPAQVAYFAGISLMLLPVPFALEGAAWVMAAGVALADERKLAPWVRWLLRGLSMSAAAFAARINYLHGAETGATVGWGLAAVTMLGPLFFEVRQWVTTLSANRVDPKVRAEAKAKAAHAKKREKDHKEVVKIAGRLMSAATFGTLAAEDAFRAAHQIVHGTSTPGMTRELCAREAQARKSLTEALVEAGATAEGVAVELFLADLFGPGSDGDGNGDGTPGGGPEKGPQGGGGGSSRTSSGGGSEGRAALGRKRKREFGRTAPKTPDKPLAEADLATVRSLAESIGDASKLTHSMVKAAVGGGSNDYLVRLRRAVQAERPTD